MEEKQVPVVQQSSSSSKDRGRPVSTGTLSGDDMEIEWKVWAVAEDLLGMLPVAIVVTFRPQEGEEFKASGEFAMDPITFERRVKDLKDWNRYLVQMAQMTVMSAKRAAELQ